MLSKLAKYAADILTLDHFVFRTTIFHQAIKLRDTERIMADSMVNLIGDWRPEIPDDDDSAGVYDMDWRSYTISDNEAGLASTGGTEEGTENEDDITRLIDDLLGAVTFEPVSPEAAHQEGVTMVDSSSLAIGDNGSDDETKAPEEHDLDSDTLPDSVSVSLLATQRLMARLSAVD